MNKIRKLFLAVTAFAMLLLVSACGKDNTPFKHGSWSSTNTYTSDFLGIKIQAGSDWTISADAEIAKNFGITDMSDSSIMSVLDKGRYITEMAAGKADGANINIVVQDNDKSVGINEKNYFTDGVKLAQSQLELLGITCTAQKGSVIFLGKSTDCIEVTIPMDDATLYEVQVPIFKSHYTASITFAAFSKAEMYSLVTMVTEL